MRLLLLSSGIVFFGIAVWLIKSGINAEGTIDVRSAILSGSVKTGSAGVLIAFLSFFMILASVLFSKWPSMLRRDTAKGASPLRIMVCILFSIYALTVGAYLLARSTTGDEKLFFGFLTAAFIILSVLFSLLTFFGWLAEEEEKEKRAEQRTTKP